jgi:hypothetical protein
MHEQLKIDLIILVNYFKKYVRIEVESWLDYKNLILSTILRRFFNLIQRI